MTTAQRIDAYRKAYMEWYEQKRKYPELNMEVSRPKFISFGLTQWAAEQVERMVRKELAK